MSFTFKMFPSKLYHSNKIYMKYSTQKTSDMVI